MKSKPLSIPYGSQIDSHEINLWSQQVIADLKQAMEDQKAAREQAELVLLLQSYENLFLSRQQEQLAQEFRLLRRDLQAFGLQAGELWTEVSATEATVLEGQILATYGILLPPFRTVVDRLPASSSPRISVFPAPDGVLIRDTQLGAIVDHRYETVWLRTVEVDADSDVAAAEAQLQIELPDQVVTTRLNMVGILPFPCWGLDILSIEVETEQGVWETVQEPVGLTGPLLSVFSPVHTRRIRIRLQQRHPILFGNKKIFVMGLRDVTALSATFDEVLHVRVPLHLPKAGMWLRDVSMIPAMDARIHVRVLGSDVLPVQIPDQQTEVEVMLEGADLRPVQGLAFRLTR